jgi:hypothetical protein
MRTIAILIAIALPAIAVTGCGGCEGDDDEARIRSLFRYAVETAENRDVGELMELTTEDFTVAGRGISRQETKGVLLMAFRRYGAFTIRHPNPSVEVSPSGMTATAETPFLLVRDDREAPDLEGLYESPAEWLAEVGELADLYDVKLWLVKTDDGWRVKKARLDGYRRLEEL